MNWLGWSTRAIVGALLGALLGAVGYHYALVRAFDAPWLVGIGTGLGAFLGSPDRSGMRGLLVATFAIWVAWGVQVRVPPFADAGLFGFYRTLTPGRLLAFATCGAAAFLLARSSVRRSARHRVAGS